MVAAMLQQRVVVYVGSSDCWHMVGMWGRWTILLTSHRVEAIVLGPVRQGQTQHVDIYGYNLSDSAVQTYVLLGVCNKNGLHGRLWMSTFGHEVTGLSEGGLSGMHGTYFSPRKRLRSSA